MKLLSMFLLLMSINIALLMYSAGANQTLGNSTALLGDNGAMVEWDTVNPAYGELNQYNDSGTPSDAGNYNSLDFWKGFLNPMGGNNSRIVLYLVAFALLIGALGFIPFINRSDLSVLSGPFIILVAVSGPTIVGLWSFINGQSSGFFCEIGRSCFISNLLASIIAGTLFISWIFACLEWWTGRPSS
jgi:hypothetical protein